MTEQLDEQASHEPKSCLVAINGGSSSLKFAVFSQDGAGELSRIRSGRIERIGLLNPQFRVEGIGASETPVNAPDLKSAAVFLIDWLAREIGLEAIAGIGHRIVHGGDRCFEPQIVTTSLIDELRRIIPMDPNHLPGQIALLEVFGEIKPPIKQVVCFDTAFHHNMPRVAQIVPIPRHYESLGVRRYGFHGLSYSYVMEELGTEGRVIVAHLGSGASLAAIRDGQSIETTMGFTPCSGLVMSTRTGDLDPGLPAFLSRMEGMTPETFDQMATHKSGLLGVSETSPDIRDLIAHQHEDARAAEAVSLFCYRVKMAIGALSAALGGVETLVFCGGIGENSPEVRAQSVAGLGFLGINLDEAQNAKNAAVLSSDDSRVVVRMIHTDEEIMIARAVAELIPGFGIETFHRSELMSQPTVTNSHTSNEITPELLHKIDAYWRAANYLSVGQIYLLDNPLLKEPLQHKHIKPRLLGHWGTTPGLNFIYAHLNRVIKRDDLHVLYVAGPGHGGPGIVANVYLEGTYSEVYPNISQDEEGLRKLFKQFSFPGGIPSHVAPETPGSIHEGGELGYALSHAYGAAFDNPDLLVACVVGDGEAETGPLATSWHSNKFLNPARDGAVLPILHLNGYKIANPCFLARIPQDELRKLFEGYGYAPIFVEGHDPSLVHPIMAAALDTCVAEIKRIQLDARTNGFTKRPAWPMIVLRTPKGWTCPKFIDGKKCEDYWRSHQVPMGDMSTEEHVKILEGWMKSYKPEELFDETGRLRPELAELAPVGEHRMGANPHANGGVLLHDLRMPNYQDYAVAVPTPGSVNAEATRVQGMFLRDIIKLNMEAANFRLFSPDECASNRWQDVFEVTDRCYVAEILPEDDHLSPDGRVMEVLSEHQCQGWLEGYLLTGRHGFFSCYEAFIHIIDSMFNQHAKWLKVCHHIPWRRPIASLNYLLSSHVWRQDHNGFSHQDPGFIDHVANKKSEVIRIYLPPDANTLLSVTDHCLRSRDYVNVVVAGKQPAPQWLTMDEAVKHCEAGLGIWEWASNDKGAEPDVVMACCGDVPTMETLAAVELLHHHLPELKIRVVNVVNLMKLQPHSEHPHGLPDKDFDALFTTNKPVIFAFHGYPWLIHRFTYRRTNHDNFHVRGFKEEGTTTTPFDMVVLNQLDRFNLMSDVIDRVPGLAAKGAYAKQAIRDKLIEHRAYIVEYGEDMPEIRDWVWGQKENSGPHLGAKETSADNA